MLYIPHLLFCLRGFGASFSFSFLGLAHLLQNLVLVAREVQWCGGGRRNWRFTTAATPQHFVIIIVVVVVAIVSAVLVDGGAVVAFLLGVARGVVVNLRRRCGGHPLQLVLQQLENETVALTLPALFIQKTDFSDNLSHGGLHFPLQLLFCMCVCVCVCVRNN